MEKMIRGKISRKAAVFRAALLTAVVLLIAGCSFFIFPEGYRSRDLFSINSPLLYDIIEVESENTQSWRVSAVHSVEELLLVALENDGDTMVLVYDAGTMTKTGEFALEESAYELDDPAGLGRESGGTPWIVLRNRTKYILGSEVSEENIPSQYTDFGAGNRNIDNLRYYFTIAGIPYCITDTGDVVDLSNQLQTDAVFYPEGFINSQSWFSSDDETLYSMTVSATEYTGDPVENIEDLELFGVVEIRIAAFPMDEIGSWKDNYSSYWESAYVLSPEEEYMLNSQDGQYIYPRLTVKTSGSMFALSDDRNVSGLRVIDAATGEILFEIDSSYGNIGRGYGISADGQFIYKALGDYIMQLKIR